MTWFLLVVAVAVVGLSVVVAVRGPSVATLVDAADDRRDVTLPTDRPLDADDLAQVRFTTGLLGYRADEVDALIARLRAQLARAETAPAHEPQES